MLLVSDDRTRINAAFSFYAEKLVDDIHHFHLNVLIRHLECSHQGFGEAAYSQFLNDCFAIIDAGTSASAALFTTEAHVNNQPASNLLDQHGWQRVGAPDSSGYADWALKIEIT